MKNKFIRKWDIFIIGIILLISLSFLLLRYFSDNNCLIAKVYVNGNIYETINLSSITERKVISPDTDPKVTIVAEKGCIYFEDSGCSDKICVRTGKLTKRGDTAICLPATVVVSIEGSGLDAVTW